VGTCTPPCCPPMPVYLQTRAIRVEFPDIAISYVSFMAVLPRIPALFLLVLFIKDNSSQSVPIGIEADASIDGCQADMRGAQHS